MANQEDKLTFEDAIEKLETIVEEVEQGDGEVIRAYATWHRYLEAMRRNDKDEQVVHLLCSIIEEWRLNTAVQHQVSPASILPEHIRSCPLHIWWRRCLQA